MNIGGGRAFVSHDPLQRLQSRYPRAKVLVYELDDVGVGILRE